MLSLVDKYGAPLYVYDSAVMKANYERFMNAFDVKDLKLYWVLESNTLLDKEILFLMQGIYMILMILILKKQMFQRR